MNKRDYILLAVLVSSLVIMSIGMKQLTNQHVVGAQVLAIRSIGTLLFAVLAALYQKRSLIPRFPLLQGGSFIFIGLYLMLIYSAFDYLSAGAVVTLERLDIPILVLIASFNTRVSPKQLFLAVLSLVVLIFLLFVAKNSKEIMIGYFIALVAVGALCANTIIQKKLVAKENPEVIIIVTSLSSIAWASLRCYQISAKWDIINYKHVLFILILSLINFALFYVIIDLYKRYKPESIRYPYLIAAFFTMLVEIIITNQEFNPVLVGGNIVLLIVISFLILEREKAAIQD